MTILLIEKNANTALEYVHYVFLLENGKDAHADKPEVIKRDKRIQEVYLGLSGNISTLRLYSSPSITSSPSLRTLLRSASKRS